MNTSSGAAWSGHEAHALHRQALSIIAVECGLADQAHLTRLFRRIVGESPAAWRRARVNPL